MHRDDGTALAALDHPIPYSLTDTRPPTMGGYFKVIPHHSDPKRALLGPVDGIFVYRDRFDREAIRAAYDLAVKLVGQLVDGARIVAWNPPAVGFYKALEGAVG